MAGSGGAEQNQAIPFRCIARHAPRPHPFATPRRPAAQHAGGGLAGRGRRLAADAAGLSCKIASANADASYGPLWALVEVRWKAGSTPRLLQSEEALLAAEQAGQVELRHIGIEVNCPVVRTPSGGALKDLR